MLMTHNGNPKYFERTVDAENFMHEQMKRHKDIRKICSSYPKEKDVIAIHVFEHNNYSQEVFVVTRR